MTRPPYAISPAVQSFIESHLSRYDLTLNDTKTLAECVLRLSDWFVHQPDDPTPWKERWAQIGYLVYFLPLNEMRVRAVIDQGLEVGFFHGLERVLDFGAGPGTASQALREKLPLKAFGLAERAPFVHEWIRDWNFPDVEISTGMEGLHPRDPSKTLFTASYSLTETALPPGALDCEALMLIEPATHQDGQTLLKIREDLLAKGYSAWAPCPHQQRCPLHETRDWCHDRIHVELTEWQRKLENHLPIKNFTLTFSYLLARQKPAPVTKWARLTGDSLKEKGKTRQLVCRGTEREFLSWLDRHKNSQELPRGIRVKLPDGLEKQGNELRVPAVDSVQDPSTLS